MVEQVKISIWSFDEAPKKYQNMSKHGGDENWVVVFHGVSTPWETIDAVSPPLHYLLPYSRYWDNPQEQQERNYAVSWGFIQNIRDGNDLVAITAHA